MLPEDLKELAEEIEDQADLREGDDLHELESKALEREQQTRAAFDIFARSIEGVVVLRRIMEITGYQAALCHKSATGFDTNGSLYNVARRDVWVELRGYLKPKALREIENPIGD